MWNYTANKREIADANRSIIRQSIKLTSLNENMARQIIEYNAFIDMTNNDLKELREYITSPHINEREENPIKYKRHKLTRKVKQAIIESYDSGVMPKQLSEEHKVPVSVIYNLVAKYKKNKNEQQAA